MKRRSFIAVVLGALGLGAAAKVALPAETQYTTIIVSNPSPIKKAYEAKKHEALIRYRISSERYEIFGITSPPSDSFSDRFERAFLWEPVDHANT